jgi:hypothetical protein
MGLNDAYRTKEGGGKYIDELGSIFIFNMTDPSDDISQIIHITSSNNHAIKSVNGIYYPGRVKHLASGLENSPKIIGVNYNKFMNYAANHVVTSNGNPVNVDANGNITLQRV